MSIASLVKSALSAAMTLLLNATIPFPAPNFFATIGKFFQPHYHAQLLIGLEFVAIALRSAQTIPRHFPQ